MAPWPFRRWSTGPSSGGTGPAAAGTGGGTCRPLRLPREAPGVPVLPWAAGPDRPWEAERPPGPTGQLRPAPAAEGLTGAAVSEAAPWAEAASDAAAVSAAAVAAEVPSAEAGEAASAAVPVAGAEAPGEAASAEAGDNKKPGFRRTR